MADTPMTNLDRRAMIGGIIVAILGIASLALGFTQAGATPMINLGQSYLYAWVVSASITLGCFALSVLFHMTRGRWATPLLRLWEAGGGPIPLIILAIAFIPIAFVFRDQLYAGWIHADPSDKIIARKHFYLNETGWTIRIFFFLLSYAAIAGALQSWMRKEEKTGDRKWGRMRNNTCAVAMVYFILTMTFVMTDVVMSLDPHWYSTIFPVTFVISSALMAMSFTVFTVISCRKEEPYKAIVEDKLMLSDFGNVLLMFVMVWTYFTFSQLLIIWSGNLPSLTQYYRARMTGNYGTLGFLEAVFNFATPFLALLSIPLKKNPIALGTIAVLIFISRLTDLHYMIMPFVRPALQLNFMDYGCLGVLFGIWLIVFAILMRRAPLVVAADPSGAYNHPETAHA